MHNFGRLGPRGKSGATPDTATTQKQLNINTKKFIIMAYSNYDTAVKFANGIKPGRTIWGSSCHADENTFFSYGTCICEKAGNVYYFNATRYSNTTAKHQSNVLAAINTQARQAGAPLVEGETLVYVYLTGRKAWGVSSLKEHAFKINN